jgi:hypothetical protein
MQQAVEQDLRYPVGKFKYDGVVSEERRAQYIAEIAETPARLRAAIAGLGEEQLDTPYRPEGWSVRQVVHHVPDSHLNAYVRFKLALTEETPTIKPYNEAAWAELPDSKLTPVATSLSLLESVHARWLLLLRALQPADFQRGFLHPEHGKLMDLDKALAMYAWHGKHHVAHITALRQRMGW